MSVRLLNDCCRLLLRGGSWRALATSSVYQAGKGKKWSDDKEDIGEKQSKETSYVIGDELHAAVESVAQSLSGNKKQTESDLLSQLLTQAKTQSFRVAPGVKSGYPKAATTSTSSELLSNMTIQKKIPMRDQDGKGRKSLSNRSGRAISTEYELFEGPGLDIFTAAVTSQTDVSSSGYDRKNTLRYQLEQEEFAKVCDSPPTNAFEEMISWTREGKLWTFPINNEAGMEEEANVGFHEHVFLEDRITDFPTKGPIRHFIELVLVGLSKNPYLSVQQKHEHIDWFRQYFKEKEPMLKESLGDASQFSDG